MTDTDDVKAGPIAKTAIVLVAVVGAVLAITATGYFFDRIAEIQEQYRKPTADELYGCTVRNAAPNGECQ